MDDIDYLKANSQKHSYMFYVDSAKRNRNKNPNPNYYEVVFNAPLKNVYSIQVLDASIPRTHYNVDEHNNLLFFKMAGTETSVKLDIGEYTTQQLLVALNEQMQPYGISVSFLSSPSDKRKQFIFKSSYMFTICTSKSSLRKTLGFDEGGYMCIDSVDDTTHYETFHPMDSLSNNTTKIPIEGTRVLYQRMIPNETGNIDSIQFNITEVETMFSCTARIYNNDMETIATSELVSVTPNMTIVTFDKWLVETELIQSNEYFVSLNSTNDAQYSIYTHITSVSTHLLYIYQPTMFSSFSPDACSEFMASLYLVPGTGTTVARTNFGLQTVQTALTLYLELNMRVTLKSRRWSIVPPGIYNLIGDRYVLMRCKEIENHILSSIKSYDVYDHSTDSVEERQYETGIAKFKMGVVGYREERFDFNILPAYEFHPIGKMSSLTFLFENPDGQLYNFRGVNHTVTLVINYYKPVISYDERNNMKSTLYPAYEPMAPIFKTDDDIYNVNI